MNANTETAALIAVESQPALITVNFDEVKERLETELKKYDVVVTADTLADAKKLATELNKNASEFDKSRKEAVAKVSGPIKTFESQMKELVAMCKTGRQKIIDQVKRFEDETKQKASELIYLLLSSEWEKQGVNAEFRSTICDDLIKLTALTKAGNLTSATTKEIESRVSANKQFQDQTEMRLLKLENESYKAGLAAPLTRAHVEAFLFEHDDIYQTRLAQVMESEINREKQAEQAMRERLAKEQAEQQRIEEAKQAKAAQVSEQAPIAEQSTPAQAPIQEEQPQQEQRFTPPAQPSRQAIKHAYGPLSDPASAIVEPCSFDMAAHKAMKLDDTQTMGIWTKEKGLIAITYYGEVFLKSQA